MAFINSENIKFYPSGYRGKVKVDDTWYSIDPESKLNTEENVTRSYNVLIPYKNINQFKEEGSLVITKNYHWLQAKTRSANDINDIFEFIIHGYYLKVLHTSQVFPSILEDNPSDVYAHIRIKEKGIPETSDPNNIYLSGKAVISSNDEPIVNNPEGGSTTNYSNLDYTVDDNIIFYGLELLTTTPTIKTESDSDGYEDYYFKILTRENGDYIVPDESKIILSLDDIWGGGIGKNNEIHVNARKRIVSSKIDADVIDSEELFSTKIHCNLINDVEVDGNNRIKFYTENSDVTNPKSVEFTGDIQLSSNYSWFSGDRNYRYSTYINDTNDGEHPMNIEYKYGDYIFNPCSNGEGIYWPVGMNTSSWVGKWGTPELNIGNNKYQVLLLNRSNRISAEQEVYFNSTKILDVIAGSAAYTYNDFDNTVKSGLININNQVKSINQTYKSYDGTYVDVDFNLKLNGNLIDIKGVKPWDDDGDNSYQKQYFIQMDPTYGLDMGINNLKNNTYQNNEYHLKLTPEGEIKTTRNSDTEKYFSVDKDGKVNAKYFNAQVNSGDVGVNSSGIIQALKFKTSFSSLTNVGFETRGQVKANSFYAISDKRLKDHIEPIDYNKSILDLPVYTYTYKDCDRKQIGCMAQDLQKLYPELVDEDENGYLSVDNSKVVYLLLEEVKLLKKEIEDLKKSK